MWALKTPLEIYLNRGGVVHTETPYCHVSVGLSDPVVTAVTPLRGRSETVTGREEASESTTEITLDTPVSTVPGV